MDVQTELPIKLFFNANSVYTLKMPAIPIAYDWFLPKIPLLTVEK